MFTCLALTGALLAAAEPVVDAQGVHLPGYRYERPDPKPTPWRAQWIWLAQEPAGLTAACFRREVTLAAAPTRATAWITADTKYLLYVNGRLVGRGPADQGRDYAGGLTRRWFYERVDLTPFLRAGANAVAVEVFRHWPIGFTVSTGRGGLLLEAEAELPGGTRQVVASDPSWRALPAPHWSPQHGLTLDAAREPAAWREPGFDDRAWQTPVVVPTAWPTLVPSELPPLMEARYPVLRLAGASGGVTLPAQPTQPIRVTADGSFRVVFDRVLSGYPTLRVTGGRGATVVVKACREAALVLGDGPREFAFPFMDEIVPAYTVTLTGVTEPLTIDQVGAVFTSQPVDYRGSFACSDVRLNRLWEVSRWAVQLCLQTHHLDSPNHQEPISDPGDYQIESMVANYAFLQPALARQDLRKFAWLLQDEHYHNFHISYSLYWLQWLLDTYDVTGDRALVEELAPVVHALLDTYAGWRGRNGLISEAPNYMFMDWVEIGGFGCHHPPAVIGQGYLTALYCHGLDQGRRIAEMMGDTARATQYRELRAQTAAAFERELWVPERGLYRDGKPHQTSVAPHQWLPADTDIETFSPHVNLLAVLYDLAPAARQAELVDRVLAARPLNTQPWFMHWVFAAIDHAGRFETYGTDQLRRWQVVPETQSFREMWHGGDLSHGWCSTPLVQLSARVLGVTPAEPGYRTIAIAPHLCDLEWAHGSVPTPHGDVVVSWQAGPDQVTLDVTVPPGCTADVTPPVAAFELARVTRDGAPVSQATVRVAAGQHQLVVRGVRKPRPAPPALPAGSSLAAAQTNAEAPDALEAELPKADLLRAARVEEHCTHTGGGGDASALFNGTTRNGAGGADTADDGRTFRGYGDGDWLTLHLDTARQPAGYTLSEVRTFAGHADSRASQHYTLLLAYAADPTKFVPLADAAVTCDGGASQLRLAKAGGVLASGVVALRFEFRNGSAEGPGHGFNVYREVCVCGR